MAQGKRNDPTVQPSEVDKAYAAGFIDGEGTIYVRAQRLPIHREKNWQASAYGLVVVSQVDPRPLQWMQARWGGALRSVKRNRTPNERDAWEWGCSSRQADQLLHDVIPHLRCKQAQAVNALRLEAMKRARGSGPIPPDALILQAGITAEARRLNQERPTWNELPEVF